MKYTIFLFTTMILVGSCKFEEKIRDGNTAYDRKQYAVAIPMLKDEISKSKSNVERGEKAYKLGESYRFTNQIEAAEEWYQKSFYNYSYDENALKEYAFALKQQEKYDEAIEAFKELGDYIGDPFEYQREIIACRQSRTWAKNRKKAIYQIDLPEFNSSSSDYYPTMYEDGKLVITSDRSAGTGENIYQWTGNDFSDLFLVDPENGSVKNFSEKINSPYNEGAITFNGNFTEAYFTRCGDDSKEQIQYCKLYMSQRFGDSWSEPQLLEFTEERVNYGHPAISADGKTLYFSSDHPDGLGGFDIFESKKKNGDWDFPRNLGSAINTEGNEISPFLDKDTLYFASDFHVGMGGFDIFKTAKLNNKKWGSLQNLKAPINSGANDFAFVIDYQAQIEDDKILQTGYFTSTREDGAGNDDIYNFKKVVLPPEPKPVIDTTNEPLANDPNNPNNPNTIQYKMILNGRVMEKIYMNPGNPNSGVSGKQPLANTMVQINLGDTSFTINPGKDGTFRLELEEQTAYNFFASKSGYLSNSSRFSTRGIERDPENPIQEFSTEIVLDKIFTNVQITLENIYYDFNQSFIRNDAQPTLNRLANILQQNPNIRIQLASHTDCRGSDNINLDLSQRRAQAAVDYLVLRGIDIDRLEAKGYGKTQPTADCACRQCTEEQHQENRRTTFTILE